MRNHILLATSVLLAGGLALAEVTHESFDAADTNNDDVISKDEFYGFVGDAGIYADYDYDGDGFIDETEFDGIDWNDGVDFDDEFNEWDVDGDSYLTDNELYDGYFDYYDEDEDGHWDTMEWDDAGDAGLFDI